jgi:alpha-beta hydrolase superfamily lysophospholipase
MSFDLDRGARLAGLTAWHAVPRLGPGAPVERRSRPALFVHGMWEGAWFWETWLGYFARRGWEGWAIDLRGHGASRDDSTSGRARLGKHSIHDYLDDARRAVAALLESHGEMPVIFGHSMGGLLTEKLAEELDPPAAVAVTPAAPRGFFAVQTPELARAVLHHMFEILFWRPLDPTRAEAEALELNRLPPGEQDRAHALMQPESGRQAFDVSVVGLPVDRRRIHRPLLLVGAADDRITPARLVRRVARRLRAGSRECEYREYEGHAHMIVFEPGWERVAGEVAEWVERHVPERS